MLKPDEDKKLCIFSFIILSLFAGLSYDIGWDYMTYREAIIYGDIGRFEYLERILMQYTRNVPQLFFLVNHTLIVGFTMWTINRYASDKLIAIFVYICFPYQFLFGLSTIRAAVVASIVFWGYEYFLNELNKPVLYIIVVGIGFFIHQATLIAILLLFVHYIKIGRWGNLIILFLSLFTAYIHIDLTWLSIFNGLDVFTGLSDKLEYYSDVEFGGGTMIHYCFFILAFIGVIFYRHISNNKTATVSLSMITIGFFLSMLFHESPVLSSRFSRFFYIFCVLLIPEYIKIFPKRFQPVVRGGILLVLITLLLYQLSIPNYIGLMPNRISTYWPYQTIFEYL